MDFGLLGFDDLVGFSSSSYSSGFGSAVSDPLTKQKLYGSVLFRKQERSVNDDQHCDDVSMNGNKRMAKKFGDNLSGSDNVKAMSLLGSNDSPLLFPSDSYHHENQMLCFPSPKFSAQNSGCNTTYNGFTASQWIELEQQTLIYKYICANIPLPSTLLLPIRKAFESPGFSCLDRDLLSSDTLVWGGFNLGYSNSADPEPGRCRRTDGKKWRCSKDAVPDQKYCERHMNRGRHRSRKLVEGKVQSHSSAPMDTTIAKASSVVSGTTCTNGIASKNTFALPQHQPIQSSRSDSINGVFMACIEKQQETSSTSMLSSRNVNLKPEDPCFHSKHQNPFSGIVPSNSLLNPSQGGSTRLAHASDQATEARFSHQLLQFTKNWSQNPSQRTQLAGSSDFCSSTPKNRVKTATNTLSPLRFPCEDDSIPKGFGVQVGSRSNIPLSWESSLGGPLGEALQNSRQSSPTGVLQETNFVSMSNSSSGSSPRADSEW